MTDDAPPSQRAEGNYIAQADRGGIATVNVTLSDSLTSLEKRNRVEMLRKVKQRVEQKLKASLYNNFMLNATFEYWSDVIIHAREIEYSDSVENDILCCFDDNDGRLLILGEPGSGKTILLYSLANSLIDRSINDVSQGIPVILNLSSWSSNPKDLDEWILDELYKKYDVSNNLSRKWIGGNAFILLLDGLDEVAKEIRLDCVKKINEFRLNYHSQMVICAREQEYEAIGEKLTLQGAVFIQPLSEEQVDLYLSQAKLEGLRVAVQKSQQLQSLLRNPLTLDIMSRTYCDVSSESISDFIDEAIVKQPEGDIFDYSSFRQKLFANYIQRMFEHHSSKSIDTRRSLSTSTHISTKSKRAPDQEETLHRLAWLAHQMVNHDETILFLENLQPSWLEKRGQRYLYRILVFIVLSLLGGFVVGGGRWLVSGMTTSFLEAFLLGSGTVLFFNYIAAMRNIQPVQKLRFSEASMIGGIRTFTNSGFIAGLIVGTKNLGKSTMSTIDTVSTILGVTFGYLAVWFIAGIVVFVLYLKSGRQREVLRTFFLFTSRTKKTRRFLDEMEEVDFYPVPKRPFRLALFIMSLLFVPVLALVDRITFLLNGYLAITFGSILMFGLSAIAIGVLGPGVYFGLTGEVVDERDEVNQGITRSIRTAVLGGLLSGVGATLLVGNLWARLFDTPGTLLNLPVGFFLIGFSAIYLGFLRLGGSAFFQHYTLRFVLSLWGYTPYKYKDFLDYASNILFLRKLGGGYEYIHRDLMEHFAQMYSKITAREQT